MEALCRQHGGQYSKDLNKRCTHLVVEAKQPAFLLSFSEAAN